MLNNTGTGGDRSESTKSALWAGEPVGTSRSTVASSSRTCQCWRWTSWGTVRRSFPNWRIRPCRAVSDRSLRPTSARMSRNLNRQFVMKRPLPEKDDKKAKSKTPKNKRLITPVVLQHKRHRLVRFWPSVGAYVVAVVDAWIAQLSWIREEEKQGCCQGCWEVPPEGDRSSQEAPRG